MDQQGQLSSQFSATQAAPAQPIDHNPQPDHTEQPQYAPPLSQPPPPQDGMNELLPEPYDTEEPYVHEKAYPPPPPPPRPHHGSMHIPTAPFHHSPVAPPPSHLPPTGAISQYDPSAFQQTSHQSAYIPPPPPQRIAQKFGDEDDPTHPAHYLRDPHKLIAYLVPFPKPALFGVDPNQIPDRFLIYTPPPPPLSKPAEGEKEAKLHHVQRKWQQEVRDAKTSNAKTASWKGVKSKATKGINWAMGQTTTANLDFLGRMSDSNSGTRTPSPDGHAHDGVHEDETTKKTVGVEEMILVYPDTMKETPDEIRVEFVNTMLRTKSKAQKDAVIATGLMPVAFGIDILATFVWPFGGLGEIDTVWAYSSIRGAKTARSVTKRLSSGSQTGDHENDKLKLTFTASNRLEVLRRYLGSECQRLDHKMYGNSTAGIAPTDTQALEAIGWTGSATEKNWEDEQWELTETKDDLRLVMHKGAKEWYKWCKAFEKNPEKALKK